MQYVAIQKHWRRLGPLYRSPAAVPIWYLEMEAYRAQRADQYGRTYRPASLAAELVPANYECCDWRVTRGRRGPEPAFWAYVCYAACHWVCNLHLWVAMQHQPDRPWRIVTSDRHSVVWDGAQTLWDGNFLALEVPAAEAWKLAAGRPDTMRLPIGEPRLHEAPDEAFKVVAEKMHPYLLALERTGWGW